MSKVGGFLSVILLFLSHQLSSQSFQEFELLKSRADSAWNAKNYQLSASFYESALNLPKANQPGVNGDLLYNVACVYSLNHDKRKAFFYLNKSFTVGNNVSLYHLTEDDDIAFIKNEKEFLALVKQKFGLKGLAIYQSITAFNSTKEISYADLLNFLRNLSDLNEGSRSSITIHDKKVFWKKSNHALIFNDELLEVPYFPKLSPSILKFQHCEFNLNFSWRGSATTSEGFTLRGIEFTDCIFKGWVTFQNLEIADAFYFKGSSFENSFYADVILKPDVHNEVYQLYGLENCALRYCFMSIKNDDPVRFDFIKNVKTDTSSTWVSCRKVSDFFVRENRFKECVFSLGFTEANSLLIRDNTFRDAVFFGEIKARFNFYNNEIIHRVAIGNYFSPDISGTINWENLDRHKLSLNQGGGEKWTMYPSGLIKVSPMEPRHFISGEHVKDVADYRQYDELMGIHAKFLNFFKTKNNIEAYNQCFVQMKEIQTNRLRYLYESNPGFENYFSWKLAKLMRFYVSYGTKPARAIVISINIILAFGVFFFFFPSDWDVTSKKRLIENYRDFIQKNEKGYVKPFFILLGGFIISLINAITLSLNAFITLGFGNIPTHGIARYFCVLEGFLGWFLLSIFTVAMINQVL